MPGGQVCKSAYLVYDVVQAGLLKAPSAGSLSLRNSLKFCLEVLDAQSKIARGVFEGAIPDDLGREAPVASFFFDFAK